MIVKPVYRPEALRYDVYIYNDDYTQTAYYDEDGQLHWESYEQGTIPRTWMVFDEYVYEAFKRAMIGNALDDDDALRDARNVRDRMIALVEAEWMAKVRDG